MPARPLNWETIHLPLGYGLYTKEDARFSSPPALDIARDVRSEQIGGLQTRPPFVAMANTIFGGGTLSNCRRMAVVNGELCVFTDVALYSWNAALSSWVLRGTHLGITVDEQTRFETTDDQIRCDRAELNGTVVYAWETQASQVYAAALDKTTGSVLVTPTLVSTANGSARLVALATKILLFVDAGANNLTVRSIDPASPGTAIAGAGTTVLAGVFGSTGFNAPYDVQRAGTQDLCVGVARRTVTTSYSVFTVTPGLTVSTFTKARTADSAIAIAAIPDGTKCQIVRTNFPNVQGDLLTTSGMSDIFTNQALFNPIPIAGIVTITAAFRSVQVGGQFRCYIFFSTPAANGSVSRYTFADTANTLGTPAIFCNTVSLASTAFDYNGSVFVWLVYAATAISGSVVGAAVQNTYFMFRDDAAVMAKATVDVAGGFPGFVNGGETSWLPSVSNPIAGMYSWCGGIRRIIPLGNQGQDYAARAPRDITVTFNNDAARRSVQLGRTLYIPGGEILQYDGTRIVEVGFHIFPDRLSFVNTVGSGGTSAGVYAMKETWRYNNGQGESERSTCAVTPTITSSAGDTPTSTGAATLTVTHKLTVAPAIEFWRTAVNPTSDAPFYLSSSLNPAQTTNPNRYVANDPSSGALTFNFTDTLTDAQLTTHGIFPENGGVLEAIAPPPATIIIATDTRLFLAGISGDPSRIWYSRERNDGEIASFNDALTIDVPPLGGAITALWFQDGVLYAGRQTAVYALPGVGVDNLGDGQGFGPAQIVSVDVGPVSQEAVCLTPLGTIFKSAKGWYLLEGGRTLRYVGSPVSAFDTDTIVSTMVITAQHQVRILSTSRLLVWDYRGLVDIVGRDGYGDGQWWEWSIANALHAALWNGNYVYLSPTGPVAEQSAFSGLTYGMDVETSWIKGEELLQGYKKLGAIAILGEYRSAFLMRVRVARDYQYDGSGNVVFFDDFAWSPSPTTVGSALQLKHYPSSGNGWGQAYKIRITAVTDAVRATLPTSSALAVTTSGSNWAATWAAVSSYPGEMGNQLSMSVSFLSSATPSIDVRDHFRFDAVLNRWIEDQGNVGVLMRGTDASTTVAQLEAAIVAGTALCTLQTPDAAPSKLVKIATLATTTTTGSFANGVYGSPTGEALRLTAFDLELARMGTLNKRLPAAQKQ